LLFDDCLDARITTIATSLWSCAVSSWRAELVKMSMHVVDVEEG
jgi:hypothetical protein